MPPLTSCLEESAAHHLVEAIEVLLQEVVAGPLDLETSD